MASFFGSQSQRTVPGGAMSSSLPVAYVAGPGPVSPTGALRGPSAGTYIGPPAGMTPQYTVAKNDACCNIRNFLFGSLIILFLGLVAAALYLVILPSQISGLDDQATNATNVQTPLQSDDAAFDCFVGFWDWQNRWSDKQQAYCCKKQKRACKPETLDVRQVEYDCYSGSIDMWTKERRTKCCETAHIGCSHLAQHNEARSYDCAAGYSNWKDGWSEAKKAWCCNREGAGCSGSLPYDCVAGFSNWEKGWSAGKKQWCCHNQQKGCVKDALYDCSAGYANWKKGWSEDKKSWCCKHESRGCTEPYDCHAGFSNWQKGWSAGKKDFCCRKHQLGCAVAEPTDLYDCKADFEQWKTEWTKDKMSWCCHNKRVACEVPEKIRVEATSTAAPVEESKSQASTTVAAAEKADEPTVSKTPATVKATDVKKKTLALQGTSMQTTTSEISKTATQKIDFTTATPKIEFAAAAVAPSNNGAVIVMGGQSTSATKSPEEGGD